ncbi:hypothetical protein HELRODRAFT_162416 [Helobdella robusta]|uniref:Uncharacterized protein n=1 Tax=Helobdella robusta TaxID=6412 RepID=T1ESM3_HELRO|nr:hypothetical protein HELRODRAFT_162416 [Helobdella robusta]ESN98944.1 hypothetical protein HELRODRAFT_162416 [Helobdella robusta]
MGIEKIFYLIDLLSLELPDDQKLTISSACKSLTLHTEASFIEPVTEIIRCWVTLFKNFNYETLFTNCSTDVVEQLRERFASKASNNSNYDNSNDVAANDGGFLKMDDVAQFENYSLLYRCMCDYYEVPCLEEVIWDIETIYCLNASKEFDFRDFENLETRNNTWFTGINLSNIKLVSPSFLLSCSTC